MSDEKMVLFGSNESAEYRENISGWVSRHGRFYGDDKQAAMMDGCTHVYCSKCGTPIQRYGFSMCLICRTEDEIKRYNQYPSKEWDFSTPIYSMACDKFFANIDELLDYIDEYEMNVDDLRLVICKPVKIEEIDSDHFEHYMPDDWDGNLPEPLQSALNQLNETIRNLPPTSFEPDKIRAIIPTKNPAP